MGVVRCAQVESTKQWVPSLLPRRKSEGNWDDSLCCSRTVTLNQTTRPLFGSNASQCCQSKGFISANYTSCLDEVLLNVVLHVLLQIFWVASADLVGLHNLGSFLWHFSIVYFVFLFFYSLSWLFFCFFSFSPFLSIFLLFVKNLYFSWTWIVLKLTLDGPTSEN